MADILEAAAPMTSELLMQLLESGMTTSGSAQTAEPEVEALRNKFCQKAQKLQNKRNPGPANSPPSGSAPAKAAAEQLIPKEACLETASSGTQLHWQGAAEQKWEAEERQFSLVSCGRIIHLFINSLE